ncbi:tail collar domain, partial [Frischella perrara]
SLTKISDNLNEQNASFFGSTYVNMPESIKPYVNKGSGVVGFVLPYRATDKGWNFSARIYAEVGVTPLNLCYQENRDDTWQKPIKLITEENVNDILPVGIPQPWPTTTPPTGWLKCDGSAFNKNKYPLLAKAYQSGFLPDLRGEFIRGLDSGANIDLNRNILSKQGDQARNATGFWFCKNRGGVDGELITAEPGGKTGGDAGGQAMKHTIDFSNVWPTGDEFRPRNIAFLYIVKAA